MESVPYVELFNNTECSKVQANHPLIALHFYSQFIFISSLFRSIYFHLAFPLLCPFSFARLRVTLWLRVLFGLFYCFFSALCPFLPARFRISFWLPDVFGLFYCFFSALCPFSPARFRISFWFPDVFGLFYCFSQLYVHFLNSIYSSFRISFWLPENFGLFYCFSCPYVHFHLLSSVFPSGFTFILDFFPCFSLFYIHMEEYRSLRTAKSSEVSRLR